MVTVNSVRLSCDFNMEQGSESECQSDNQNIRITKEQYGQLAYLLQQFKRANTTEHSDNMQMTGPTVNFAGIITCTSSINFDKPSCECYKETADLWILNLGASHHVTFNKNHLTNIFVLPYPLLVRLPNGYRVKVTEVGDVQLTPNITLYKVLFLPSSKYNLISINSMTLHLKYIISFSNTSCLLHAPSLKRPLKIDRVHDGLDLLFSECLQKDKHVTPAKNSTTSFSLHNNYMMHCQYISNSLFHPSVLRTLSDNKDNVVNADVNVVSSLSPDDNANLLWHYRLGHVPFVKMKSILSIPVVFSSKQSFFCPICHMARQTILPF